MWKLMHDEAIRETDRKKMCDFIMSGKKLSYGEKVREFEQIWSRWLGCKHSVFVNSGSSANLLIVQAAHDLYGQGNWITQSCTWATNVAPIIQLQKNGGLFLTDSNLKNLGPDLDQLEFLLKTQKVKFIFLTHVLGIPCITDKLLELCKQYNVIIFEDCCESHGSIVKGKRVGTYGLASSFSFFYGHHITTIEGGMICTNDDNFYHRLLLLRSHGLLRELPDAEREKNIVSDIDPRFTFLCPGYNVRNTDLHAVLGISQMDRLDETIQQRNKNFKIFCEEIDKTKYHCDFDYEGSSLFAFPIIAKNVKISDVSSVLSKNKFEFRPLIAGNLMRHPMMKSINTFNKYPISNYIHDNSYYIGNNETITQNDVKKLTSLLNEIN